MGILKILQNKLQIVCLVVIQYLNLKKALDSKSSKHNLVLVEGDSIIVPKTMDVVHISGALMNLEGNSISAPHFKSRRANYYINNFDQLPKDWLLQDKYEDKNRIICDYISGMTDRFAFKLYKSIYE